MARPNTTRHRSGRNHTANTKPVSSVERPIRKDQAGKISRQRHKAKQTVSAAGIFKKPKGKACDKKNSAPQDIPMGQVLSNAVNVGLEDVRGRISATLISKITDFHGSSMATLDESRASDRVFFRSVSGMMAMFAAPLTEDHIQTTFSMDGKQLIEVVEIGQRVTHFKTSLEKEKTKLEDYWKRWEGIQEEILQLGVGVLGQELLQVDSRKDAEMSSGFRKDIGLLDLEHRSRVEELLEDIDGVSTETLLKIKASEKACDAAMRREQAKLLAAIIET
ncbi:hypothetical protein B7494_g7936 [Chlorociboria aeruginascens]|nr:hypothetical protein B7494_g7936 [Chlorociboria aeruginascens]